MSTITCTEDLRQLYQRRVPKIFYDYTESGSYTESTFKKNEADFQRLNIRQRVGIDISDVDTSTRMTKEAVSMPVALAPVGMLGAQSAGGEIKAALAAKEFGIPFTLSTMSICSIEQVAEATDAPFWFQLYVVRDKGFVRNLIQRAKSSGCSRLVITMDLSVFGQRHRDVKNKLSIRPNLRQLANIATKPKWAADMARTPYKSFGNVVGHAKGVDDVSSVITWAVEQIDPSLTWDDIEWIRNEWGGPVILKGIMDPVDAKIAADVGVETIVVSNHGGRQLDGASSSIMLLPQIADAVGGRLELMMDSGVRTGMDIFRACALGASGVMLGRAMVYALGAMGQPGVLKLLDILHKELKTTMGLAGKTSITSLETSDVFLDSRS